MSNKEEKEKNTGIFKKFWKKTKKLDSDKEPILFLRSNGIIEPKYVKSEDRMYNIQGNRYHEREGSDWLLKDGKNKRTIKVIPEWGNYPLGNNEYLEELKGEEAKVQRDMTRAIEKARIVRGEEERNKGGLDINPKMAVVGIIALIVIGYLIFAA